ncbi:MAG TPA: hypothetical protein VGO62_12225 [Myxococcota bacterium]
MAATPERFEDAAIASLRDVELEASGTEGLTVAVIPAYDDVSDPFSDVHLPARVALRLPAGPAQDAPAGSSGALWDLGGLALTGMLNLVLLPFSIPLGILSGRPDAFFIDAPTFSEGQFNDVVLDDKAWQAEVERRAAPHKAELAEEAARQRRFADWWQAQHPEKQARACTIDATGRCVLRVRWGSPSLRVQFTGLPCTQVEPPPAPVDDDAKPKPIAKQPALVPAAPVLAFLPSLPSPPMATLLDVPERAALDMRGVGARATREAWAHANDVELEGADVDALWKRASKGPSGDLEDVTLVCKVNASRAHDWDLDGSPPELHIRLALGFDSDVVGASFAVETAWHKSIGLRHVSLRPGEVVKISVVDVDTFVDDWGGMALARYDGKLPLKFRHGNFDAECRAVGSSAIER